MASEAKKRKSTTTSAPALKKAKVVTATTFKQPVKVSPTSLQLPKSQASVETAVSAHAPLATKNKRKRASDFFGGDNGGVAIPEDVMKQQKKAKKATVGGGEVPMAEFQKRKGNVEASRHYSKATENSDSVEDTVAAIGDDPDDNANDGGDQSAALLQGFESTSDEEGSDIGGVEMAEIPAPPANRKSMKKLQSASKADDEGPGVIYVGRVPHGFYEHQMRAYFSQFGDITRLRLSRNKKTGHSKHYAFIEFASAAVAKIVAATMNKYLLFGHILQVRTLAPEEVHKDLFKGANKRFKVVPRNKIQARHLRLPMAREQWDRRIEGESKRRHAKEEKLMALGYEFHGPELKRTRAIPFRKAADETPKELNLKKTAEEQAQGLPESVSATELTEMVKVASDSAATKPKAKGTKLRSKAKRAVSPERSQS